MSIKSDNWIRRMAAEHGMIEPFEAGQVRHATDGQRIVSYGTSSYGYDVRCANEFKIFTNINSTIVDPKHFDEKSFVDVKADACLIPPNSFALARTVEYFRIPRSVLTVCLGKSTYARCFAADTRVALVDGSSATLEQMAARSAGGELFWGYSLGEHGRIIVSLLDAPRFVGRDSLIELTLDSGEVIRATPDHMFFRRDGRLAPAGELRPGDSMMPLYRDIIRGYESVYQPLNGHMLPTHRLADEWNLKHGIYEDVRGTHRHHIDFNRRNNRPTNLTRMLASEHIRMHNDESYGADFDPAEQGAAISAALERLSVDRKWRESFSAAQRDRALNFWRDERFAAIRERLLEKRRNPTEETREAHRQATLRRFQDETQVARGINIRAELTEDVVRHGLDQTGSIRGAARYLNCDRSVFRRFPQVISSFHGTPGRNHKIASVRELPGDHDVYCLTVPEAGNFALEAGVFVKNCGIIVNVTPLEPEWEGHVTLEFSNTTPLPARIYANEGVAQMLFFESDEVCSTSYRDRGGKYMGQKGVTLPKT
jgi:deoxycytidine triphosphate deaminase